MSTDRQRILPEIEEKLKAISAYDYSAIRSELHEKILRKIDTPEEKVRYLWVQKLIHEYGYDSKKIDINIPAGVGRHHSNVFADIVVYHDSSRTEPFIVGEVKEKGKRDGIDGEQGGDMREIWGLSIIFGQIE